jgi:hypothetical protein
MGPGRGPGKESGLAMTHDLTTFKIWSPAKGETEVHADTFHARTRFDAIKSWALPRLGDGDCAEVVVLTPHDGARDRFRVTGEAVVLFEISHLSEVRP